MGYYLFCCGFLWLPWRQGGFRLVFTTSSKRWKGNAELKTKSQVTSSGTTYSFVFLFIFLGSLLIPFITVAAGLTGLLDRFKGKERFITAYTESRLWLGDQVFNQTIVGSDGWLYLNDGSAMNAYQKVPPLSRKDLKKIRFALEKFQREVDADGGVLLFVILPDKQTIYPEHIPATIPRREGPSPLDQLITYLAENGSPFPILDLRPALLEAKQDHPLYFATDSHWNPFGAFIAYQKIIESLQPSFPNLSPSLISDYKVVTGDPVPLDLPRIIGSTSRAESPFRLVPIHPPRASMVFIEVPTRSIPRRLYFSHTDDNSAPTVLVFDDSFFFELRPFVSEHFSQAVYIDHLATPQISWLTWYKQFHPDVVIFEMTERNIGVIPLLLGE
jgi:alginate O-acetyltransferase complex protein AlgJ